MSFKGNLTANLAYQSHAKGEMEKAKGLYESAIAQGMDKAHLYDAYGVLMMTNGEFDKSIEIFSKAIKMKPTLAERYKIRVHRAIAYIKIGDMEHARVALEDMNSKKELETVYETLSYFYVITDDEKAHSYNEQAINLYPENVIILDNIAQYYIGKGRPEIAREFLEEAFEINDNKVDVNYHLAIVEQASGNKAKALEYINKAKECKVSALNDASAEDIEKLVAQLA